MDIKESIKKLIEQSTELLNKLEANCDDVSDDVEIFDRIVEQSKTIATKLKSRSTKPQLCNGNKSSGDESRVAKIKLVPIDKLTRKSATIVLEKCPIVLSDSDNEVLAVNTKPKTNDTDKAAKASILKTVFSHSTENVTKNCDDSRLPSCRVNLSRIDLNRLAKSNGLQLRPTVSSTKKSSVTVRFKFVFYPDMSC